MIAAVFAVAALLPGGGVSWAGATIVPTPTPTSGVTGQWVMAESFLGDVSTQVGVMEQAGQPPRVFWQDGAGSPYRVVSTAFVGATSGPVQVAVSCDFGTDTWYDWVGGQIVHTTTLGGAACGSPDVQFERASEGDYGQAPPAESWGPTLADVTGAGVPW